MFKIFKKYTKWSNPKDEFYARVKIRAYNRILSAVILKIVSDFKFVLLDQDIKLIIAGNHGAYFNQKLLRWSEIRGCRIIVARRLESRYYLTLICAAATPPTQFGSEKARGRYYFRLLVDFYRILRAKTHYSTTKLKISFRCSHLCQMQLTIIVNNDGQKCSSYPRRHIPAKTSLTQ